MTHEQFEQAAKYWSKKEKITMPEKALKQSVENIFRRTTPVPLPREAVIMSGAHR